MGSLWSRPSPGNSNLVRYKVILPTYCRTWEQLYNGNVKTWDAVAAKYGMDKYAYTCELTLCDREAVCLKYMRATVKLDHRSIVIERYRASTVQVPIKDCKEVQTLLAAGFRLNEVVAAERCNLVLLVLHDTRDLITQSNFPLIYLGDEEATSRKRKGERDMTLKRLSSREARTEEKMKMSSSSTNGKGRKAKRKNASSSFRCVKNVGSSDEEGAAGGTCIYPANKSGPRCLGVLQVPQSNMTIISCHISPDLSQTAILFYSMSRVFGMLCYTLHVYSNVCLQEEGTSQVRDSYLSTRTPETLTTTALIGPRRAAVTQDASQTPHLMQTVKLSREVEPYFVYDPRYRNSRITVANYECRESGIAHELVVLELNSMDEGRGIEDRVRVSEEGVEEKRPSSESGKKRKEREGSVRVIKRGKLSLPALFGNSRCNLLYSKDGELVILQKLTHDRFGVNSFCDIYIFHADNLTLIKYMTTALPGLFHICKVSYEPVFSRCGSFMRLINHRVDNTNNSNSNYRGVDGTGRGREICSEGEECITIHIYQLPRSLSLRSQCRRAILLNMLPSESVDCLPLPKKLKDYLNFGPIH